MTLDAQKPVYVLVGDDEFLKDSHRKQIISEIIGGADPQLCVASFEPLVPLADVLVELTTLPFLATRRAVLVRNADDFVDQNRKELEEYLQHPSDTASLVLIVNKWSKTYRLSKLVAKVGKVINCSIDQKDNLQGTIRKLVSQRRKSITPQAAAALLESTGRDLAAIDSEIEKLALYVDGKPEIAIEDVRAITTSGQHISGWALKDAVTSGNIPDALVALGATLTVRGNEFMVLGSLASHIRTAIRGKSAAMEGNDPATALPFNIPFKAKQEFLRLMRRRSLSKLYGDARRLIAADLALKSGAKPHAMLCELIVTLCN